MHGWDLEAAHTFGQSGQALGLAKHMNFATLRGTWHTGSQEAGLTYKRRWACNLSFSFESSVSVLSSVCAEPAAPFAHLHMRSQIKAAICG